MLDAWGHGWSVVRNTPAPVRLPNCYRIDVGLPGHAVRYGLSSAAQDAGATTGVLVGTEDGRALYTALGWTMDAPMTPAVSRG
ncbi:hypothetical protein [Kribbella sp. NPDC048915]|uniref:hypothetical protein n=1 Tax=Kribbella sp. NPDC048915 TaxID=3155148 RepID=UPI0033D02E95